MFRAYVSFAVLLAAFAAGPGCRSASVQAAAEPVAINLPSNNGLQARTVRATGTIQAIRSFTVRVPQLAQTPGRTPQLTLTALIPNGTPVKKDAPLVEFDQTAQLDDAREAQAKLDELEHQRAEKRAQVDSDSTKRVAQIREAEVELGKAEIQLKKGPVLADLDRQKNEVRAASSRERLNSLNKAHAFRTKSDEAGVRVLELKSERQRLVVARLKSNIEQLGIKAPHDGMIAHENVWRNSSMGPPQVGDQMWPNQPILRIFDPTEMIVDLQINEPDMLVLSNLTTANVYLDAYPNVTFHAKLENASPVATAGLESPVKSFGARFRIIERDARLMPDLSASLEITIPRVEVKSQETKRSQ